MLPRSSSGNIEQRFRDRVELRRFEGSPALMALGLGAGLTIGVLGVAGCSVLLVTLLHAPVVLAAVLFALGGGALAVALIAGLIWYARSGPVACVLEFAPEGAPHNVVMRSPEGALLGQTRDGSLRVSEGQWAAPAKGGRRLRPALGLSVYGSHFGTVECLGFASVEDGAPVVEMPRLGGLFPREFEYLRGR